MRQPVSLFIYIVLPGKHFIFSSGAGQVSSGQIFDKNNSRKQFDFCNKIYLFLFKAYK